MSKINFNIPGEDYAGRVMATQALMQEKNCDFILAFSTSSEPSYTRYFADFQPAFETAGIAIPRQGNATLLVGPKAASAPC